MKRKEMIERLEKGEDALELSIEKWEDIVAELERIDNLKDFDEELEQRSDNCALCYIRPGNDCSRCNIALKTGIGNCHSTPYYHFRNVLDSSLRDLGEARVVSKRELEFLKSLRGYAPTNQEKNKEV